MTPRGIANRNPLNMEKTKPGIQRWLGEIDSTDPRFAQFDKIENGYRAAFHNIFISYARCGWHTIGEIIFHWAPPKKGDGTSENNTEGYISRVCHDSGIDRNKIILPTDYEAMLEIVAAMSAVENGIPAVPEQVHAGLILCFNLK